MLLQELLKDYGAVHVAVNGKEAVEAVRLALESEAPYDLICMDIMMPEMDGQTALKKIREQEAARGIVYSDGSRVLMTTALGDLKNVMKAYDRLCDGYVTKPIRKDVLLSELRTLKLVP